MSGHKNHRPKAPAHPSTLGTYEHHPRQRPARAGSPPGHPRALVAHVVAQPHAGPARPFCCTGTAGCRAAVHGGHRGGFLVFAGRRGRTRTRSPQARCGIRPAARAPAAAGAPGTADARRARFVQPGSGSRRFCEPGRIPDQPAPRIAGHHLDRPGCGFGKRAHRGKGTGNAGGIEGAVHDKETL